MKKSQKNLVTSKTHPLKILKARRVRFDLPVKEKEDCCPSNVSLSRDTLRESGYRMEKVKSFPFSSSVEGSLPVEEMTRNRQEAVASSTHLQQDPECSLVKGDSTASVSQAICSTHAPVLSDTTEESKECPPKQRYTRSLLSVEEEIVQILAEMQMKRSGYTFGVNDEETQEKRINHERSENNATVPDAVQTNNTVIESNLKETIILNDLKNDGNGPMITDVTTDNVEDNPEKPVISNDPRDDDTGSSGNIDAADIDIKENIKAIEATDKVKDEASSASQIHVQVALKLVMKEQGPSLELLSPPVRDEPSRNVLSLKQGKSPLPQNVQIIETKMQAEANQKVSVCISLEHEKSSVKQEKVDGFNRDLEERFPGNPTFSATQNSSVEEHSDEVKVIYERRKPTPTTRVEKCEKSAVQQEESGHFSMDRKDRLPDTPTLVDIHNSSTEENSDEVEVIYDRRKLTIAHSADTINNSGNLTKNETIAHSADTINNSGNLTKNETIAHSADTINNSGNLTKNEEFVSTVQLEKSIKKEEERNFNMDTCFSVSNFPSDVNAATETSNVDTVKSEESDCEYDCPMCALVESHDLDDDQEKADCLNAITQNLNSSCPTAVSGSCSDTAGKEGVAAAVAIVKEEEPVASIINYSRYDVKEEREEDYTAVTDNSRPVSPVLDCETCAVQLKEEDTIDTEEHDVLPESPVLDCETGAVQLKEEDSIDTEEHDVLPASPVLDCETGAVQLKEEDSIDMEEHGVEIDCPPEINFSNTDTEGDLQKTVVSHEGIECGVQSRTVERLPASKEDDSVESVLPARVLDSPLPSEGDRSVESDHLLGHQESYLISAESDYVECGVQSRTVERLPASKEDDSVESVLPARVLDSPLPSEGDRSVGSGVQSRIVERHPASKEDNSIESGPRTVKLNSSRTTKEDNSAESEHSSGKLDRSSVSTGDSSILSHFVGECWKPKRTLVVKLRKIETTDYYKAIGPPVCDRKSSNTRKMATKDQPQAYSCVVAESKDYRRHIPRNANQEHSNISSDCLETTTEDSNQEDNISSENHEGAAACSYNCNSCSDVFSSKYSLIKHVFTHISLDAPEYICKFCGMVFNAAFELQKHDKTSCYSMLHKEPSHFNCQTQNNNCKNGISSILAKNENTDCEFTCSSCAKVFTSKYSLVRHVFNHIDGAQAPSHICKLCGKVLSTAFSLRRHYKYGCKKSYCEESWNSDNQLLEDTHWDDRNLNRYEVVNQETARVKYALITNSQDSPAKDVHDHVDDEEIDSYTCNVCGGIFITALRLKKHFSKICSRIEDSIQYCNARQRTTEEDGSAKCDRNGENTHCEFRCSSCPKRFSSRESLTKHTDSLHAPSYNCNLCGKVFISKFHLEMHMARKLPCTVPTERYNVTDLSDRASFLPQIHSMSQQQSDISVSSTQSSDSILSNIRVTYKMSGRTGRRQKMYLCDICDKPFKKLSNLLTHRCTHTGEKNCVCDVCGKSFAAMGNLKRHLVSHSGEYPYTCNICNRSFKQKEHLKRHRRIHTGEKPHKCRICGKLFKQSGSLQKHKVVHTGERPYKCEICGKAFGLLGNLKQHSYTHSDERCYKCDVCFKSFSRSTTLKKHSCISPGEGRRYKCTFCCKYFRKTSLLKQHLAIHSGIRDYKCNICGKSFVGSGNLKIHKYIHTGEKPYECEVCGRSFNQPSSMRRHLRVHKKHNR